MPTWAVVIGMLLRLQGEKSIDRAGVVVVFSATNGISLAARLFDDIVYLRPISLLL